MPFFKEIKEFRNGISADRAFYNLVKLFAYTIVFCVILFQVLTAFYTVEIEERAVVTQFGKVIKVEEPGLRFRVPFIQNVHKVSIKTHGIDIGYDIVKDQFIEDESFVITRDFNFLNVDFYVEWRVSDPGAFLFNSDEPELILRRVIQAIARSTICEYNVDDVLTTARNEIQVRVKDAVLREMETYNLGIAISNITIQDVLYPTQSVEAAFKNVENARQGKETAVNEANRYRNELIPGARANADKTVQHAEAVKQARINEATGQTARFNELYSEYSRNPEITRKRIYLETMEQVLPGVNLIVSDSNDDLLKFLPIDSSSNTIVSQETPQIFEVTGGPDDE